MANFTKTTKTEKILIIVLTVTLVAGLAFLFINDKKVDSNLPAEGVQLSDPITTE